MDSAHKLLRADRPLVIGHRGFPEIAPENTLPSFELALAAGADLVELDYQHSRDGVPMVFHDDTLDRTTDARKRWRRRGLRMAARTAAELGELDAGSWFGKKFAGVKIPPLAEALNHNQDYGSITLIERKSGDAETCMQLLRQHKLINQVIVMAFDWAWLREFHQLEPHQVLGALGPPTRLANRRIPRGRLKRLGANWLDDADETGACLTVWNQRVPRRAVQLAHERGMKVFVYTINDARTARRLASVGVDGIITNRVTTIRKALAN